MPRLLVATALVCALGLVGCFGSSTGSPQAENSAANSAAGAPGSEAVGKPIAVPASAKPEQVVAVFLDGLRAGDKATTASLLTTKALAETSKRQLSVCPEASPHMQYQITAAEVLADNPNGAHVNVVWTEKYEDGDLSYEVVWVLRRQQEGWRVAGMAMELVPGLGLAFLNFEDPEDMLRKQEEAMAALHPPAAETAAVPPPPQSAVDSTNFQQQPFDANGGGPIPVDPNVPAPLNSQFPVEQPGSRIER